MVYEFEWMFLCVLNRIIIVWLKKYKNIFIGNLNKYYEIKYVWF